MITKEKLELFQKYGGDLDHWYRINGSREPWLEDWEWMELNHILQDLVIIRNGLAAASFAKAVEEKLKQLCDNTDTIALIKQLVKVK